MKRIELIGVIILMVLAVGCSKPYDGYFDAPNTTSSTGGSVVQPNAVAVDSQNLMGTANAVAAQETAVAAESTSVAVNATANARAATVDAREAAVATSTAVAVSTSSALVVRATSVALDATATAVANAAMLEQRALDDQSQYLQMQRQEQAVRARNRQIWSAIFQGIAIAFAVFVAGVLAFIANNWSKSMRPIHAPDGTLVLPAGRFETLTTRNGETGSQLSTVNREPVVELPKLEGGHVMIVAPSGAGKSMAMREIIDHRRGDVIVLDPHYTPGAWGDVTVIGAGRDFDAISRFVQYMRDNLDKRATARANGQRHFQPITIMAEELPAVVGGSDDTVVEVWRQWMREGRKFGLFMVIVTQSTRVRTLGIEGEGDVLKNFNNVLLLGSAAVDRVPDLVAGMNRPAALLDANGRAKPVVIPYDARRDPESPQFEAPTPRPAQLPEVGANASLAPPVVGDPYRDGLTTERGHVTGAQVTQIDMLCRRGNESGRAIQRAVFGHHGGAAYDKFIAVVERLNLPKPNGDG
jgi:hypothetical protein